MKEERHRAFDDIVQSLDENSTRTALIDRAGKEHTYSEFKHYITGCRSHLQKLGVKKGSKVLVFVTMSIELYAILEALFSLGAITIFLDPWMKGRKMGEIIRNVKPDLFIVNKRAAKYSWLLSATWKLPTWRIKELPSNSEAWKIEEVGDDDSALITYTSGSSGTPKGANRTYSFIDAQAKALKAKLIGVKGQENIDYTNLPIVALAGFAIGNTIIIPKLNLMQIDKANPIEIIDHLVSANVKRLVVSPALLVKILAGIKLKGKGKIRKIVTGGSPISSSLVKDCIENHSDIEFEAIYGSTEAEPICASPMKAIYEKLNQPLKGVFVGEHDPNLKLCIVKHSYNQIEAKDFEKRQLADGEIGEVVITGNHVNKSYYKNQKAFDRYKIIDSQGKVWHRTGDIGYKMGRVIYLVGRENRIMQKNGLFYYPFPLEQFVEQTFKVTDLGYIQDKKGAFVLYIGSNQRVDEKLVTETIIELEYPLDRLEFRTEALPRDPRHRSKLLSEKLN